MEGFQRSQMDIKRHFEPAGRVLAATPDSRIFLVSSFVLILLLRLLLHWAFHNAFHLIYLLIAFSFFQVTFASAFVTNHIVDPLTPEEHAALRKSAILIGYVWSILLYIVVGVIWAADLWQIQLGADLPLSVYVPDAASLLIISMLCFVHFPLTLSALFWQWTCFRPREEDTRLIVDIGTFRNRSAVVFLMLGFVFMLQYSFKAAIEGEFNLPVWMEPIALALIALVIMVVFSITFWYQYRKNRF